MMNLGSSTTFTPGGYDGGGSLSAEYCAGIWSGCAGKQFMSDMVFKNVIVFVGIPVDESAITMGFIAASTNYNCIDCHAEPKVEGDWSVYAQEMLCKATVRRMISDGGCDQQDQFPWSMLVTRHNSPSQYSRRPQNHAEFDGPVRRAARAGSQ